MAFWSGEKLAIRLPTLVTPFDPNHIDCAAYTLNVGADVFITEDEVAVAEPRKGIRFTLSNNESFKIPTGQFAFLVTEEVVEVPNDALAFISMKATYKFKGLVNVSGFHVDPGWKGQLIFGVYNAGPAPVPLRRGLPLFLMWYADLDKPTDMRKDPTKVNKGLKEELTSNMSGQVFSPMNLGRQLNDIKDRQVRLENSLASFKEVVMWVAGVIAAFGVAFLIALFTLAGEPLRDFILNEFHEHKTDKTKGVSSSDSTQVPVTTKNQNSKPGEPANDMRNAPSPNAETLTKDKGREILDETKGKTDTTPGKKSLEKMPAAGPPAETPRDKTSPSKAGSSQEAIPSETSP